jgi:hypothetical protein
VILFGSALWPQNPVPAVPPAKNPKSPLTNEEALGFCRKCPHQPQDGTQGAGNNSSRGTNPKTDQCKQPATADSPAKVVNGPCPDDSQKCDPSDPNCRQGQSGGSGSGGSGSGGGGGSASGGGGTGSNGEGGSGSGGGGGSPAPPQQTTRLLYLIDEAWLHWSKQNPPTWNHGLGSLGLSWGNALYVLSANAASVQSISPSTDYREVALPSIEPVMAPANSSDLARTGFVAVNAIHSEAADVNAFATNYSRYLGAKQADDANAMLQLASALVQLSDRANKDGSTAATATTQFDRVLAPIASELLDTIKKQGNTWDKDVAQLKTGLPYGLPKDAQAEVKSAGLPAEQLAAVQAAMQTTTGTQVKETLQTLANPGPEEIPEGRSIDQLRDLAARVQSEATQAASIRDRSSATSPVPSTSNSAAQPRSSESTVLKTSLIVVGTLLVIGTGSFLIGFRGSKVRRHVL